MLKKMRAELANHNHCAVPFLSRAAVNLSWYDITFIVINSCILSSGNKDEVKTD